MNIPVVVLFAGLGLVGAPPVSSVKIGPEEDGEDVDVEFPLPVEGMPVSGVFTEGSLGALGCGVSRVLNCVFVPVPVLLPVPVAAGVPVTVMVPGLVPVLSTFELSVFLLAKLVVVVVVFVVVVVVFVVVVVVFPSQRVSITVNQLAVMASPGPRDAESSTMTLQCRITPSLLHGL